MNVYAQQRVTVMGLGREGLAVARFLGRHGARVTVSDARSPAQLASQLAHLDGLDVCLSLGGHNADAILACDLLVLSPGIDKRLPVIREAVRCGIPITSETELFLQSCHAPTIGITGTSGKTTTTTLLGEMLRQGQATSMAHPVFVGGNIGRPLIERLDEITPESWVVLELSSFQLEWLRISPTVAVVTNIAPNHLNRHATMDAYIAAKAQILAHQKESDLAVVNHDDPIVAALGRQARGRMLSFGLTAPCPLCDGAFVEGEALVLVQDGRRMVLCQRNELRVRGQHNVANALAAACVATQFGIVPQMIARTIRGFTGVAHRYQPIATIGNVTYIDDSIATSPDRTRVALATGRQPAILILGGRDKELSWACLAQEAVRRCRGVVLIGEAAPLIRRHIEASLALAGRNVLLDSSMILDAGDMGVAVALAATMAKPGDVVILAPGCASYDMYANYEERGVAFLREVDKLVAKLAF